MSKREILLEQIKRSLQALESVSMPQGDTLSPEHHTAVGQICRDLLNDVFGYRLSGTNNLHQAASSVNLVDSHNSIAAVIATALSSAKVKHIADTFCSDQLHHIYRTLIFLIPTTKPAFTVSAGYPSSEFPLQIMTLDDLLLTASCLPEDRLSKIADSLRAVLGVTDSVPAAFPSSAYPLPPAPSPIPSFVQGSRDQECVRIKHYFSEHKILFLHGEAGIGKTQLALDYAARFAPEKGAYLLPYRHSENPECESMRETILRANFTGYRFTGTDNDRHDEEYRQRLSILREQYAGALLIIDGFDQDGKPLQELCAEEAYRDLTQIGAYLLFTTRQCPINEIELPFMMQVDPLPPPECYRLLKYHGANKHYSDAALQSAAALMGHHPLFVDQLARLMGRAPEKVPLEQLPSDASPPEIADAIRKMLHAPIRCLPADWQDMLRCAALLPEGGLEASLFENALECSQRHTWPRLLNEGWLQEAPPPYASNEDKHTILSMHPYIRNAVLDVLRPSAEACSRFLERLWHYEQSYRWERIPLLAHADIMERLAQTYANAVEQLTDPRGILAQHCAELWKNARRLTEALHWQRRALHTLEALSDVSLWELARAYHFTGDNHAHLLEYRHALGCWEKVLELCQSDRATSRPDLAAAYYHVGRAHLALEEYHRAAKMLESARDSQTDTLSADHPLRRAVLDLLDKAYFKLGQHQLALEYLHQDLNAATDAQYLWLPLPSTAGMAAFIGRNEELLGMQHLLESGTNPLVLTGGPGSGKTELAVQFARRFVRGQVFYTRFDTSFTRTVAAMAQSIRPALSPEELSVPDQEACDKVISILSKCCDQDILIIDGIKSLNSAAQDPAYDALMELDCRLLLTTREEHSPSIQVKPLSYAELRRIFDKYDLSLDEAHMRDLIDSVNGNTMAIDLIAQMLSSSYQSISTEQMLAALSRTSDQSDSLPSTEHATLHRSVLAIFEIAQLSKSERTVLGCAALISEQGIDAELFRDALPPGCEKAVHALRTRGWLIRDQDVMKLQPMIRAVCLQERKPSDSQCWVFLSNLWAHYTAGKSSAVQTRQMAALFTSAAQLLTDRNVLYPSRASILWRASGQLSKAKELYDNILPKYAQILKAYEPELQTLYSEAADICIELGMHANALGYALKALELCKKAILSDSEACAHSYDSVGSIYAAMGSYQTALEYQLMALQTRQDIPYIDRLKLASSYENVGNTHLLLGDYRLALASQNQALEHYTAVLPPAHPTVIKSRLTVARLCSLLGDHREAHRHLQTALELFPTLSSPATLPVGQTYAYAGIRSFLLEDYSGAKPHIEKALDILRDYLPPGHPALLQLSFALDRILEQLL